MVLGSRKTAWSRSLKMRMFLMLVFFGCFECIAANPSKVSETGTTKDSSNISNSTHQSHPTVRNSRALAQFAYSEFGKNKGQSNDQTPKSEAKPLYIIPHMRPGRSEEKRNNDLLIPTLRFGRSDSSLIPTPRLGRSSENVEESGSSIYPDNDDVRILDGDDEMASLLYSETSNMDGVTKREDSDNMIPYPRLGRSEDTSEEGEGESKRESNDSLIPQIRYGRDSSEVDLVQFPNHFILPNMRPGRSSKGADEKGEKSESTPYGLLPYPRPGRMTEDSDGFTIKELMDTVFTSSGQLKNQDVEELANLEDYDLMFLEFPKDELDNKSEQFVIPYPRPGKRNFDKYDKEAKSNGHLFKVKSKEAVSDYVLPYPRPGKRDKSSDISNESGSPNLDDNMNDDSWSYNSGEDLFSFKRSQSGNVVPYPRPGRDAISNDNLIPQLRFGRSSSIVPYPRLGKKSGSILPYPRLGRSNSILPNLRFGRSDSILPNLRFGRSDSILPNLRFGRSDSVIPNMRYGRSDSILPNLRFGRSNSVIPNLRFGRSDSVIPNIRFGRSDSILPNLRFGRSKDMLPYPRPGRSKDIIPYPRSGRSESIVPYPRPGRSNSVLPYPRLGRSGTVLPYPRLGRSKDHESDSSSESSDETNIGFQFKSMEDYINAKEKNEHSSSKEKPNPSKKETEHVLFDSVYLLPYPRPGRKA